MITAAGEQQGPWQCKMRFGHDDNPFGVGLRQIKEQDFRVARREAQHGLSGNRKPLALHQQRQRIGRDAIASPSLKRR